MADRRRNVQISLKTLGKNLDVASVGLEMGLSVAICYWLGSLVDGRWETAPYGALVGVLIGIGAAFKALWRVHQKVQRRARQTERP